MAPSGIIYRPTALRAQTLDRLTNHLTVTGFEVETHFILCNMNLENFLSPQEL